jgi:pimeloyl-ACP methyl ester carboxylesterase
MVWSRVCLLKVKIKRIRCCCSCTGGPECPSMPLAVDTLLSLRTILQSAGGSSGVPDFPIALDIPPEMITFEQLISDILEVTNFLRKRFGQDKIYLMAHSGGSFIGIQAAARAPKLFKAYIAMAQISNQLESEKLAYKYMIEQFSKSGDKRMLQKFEKYPITQINTPSYYTMRDGPMHRLGIGTTHKMRSVISGVFVPVMLHNEYTLIEKINIWRGKYFITKTMNLWNKLVETDLTKKVLMLDIPVYFFHGLYDYTTSYVLAKDYFEILKAPIKGFYTFEQSAHSPLFEEPEKMTDYFTRGCPGRHEQPCRHQVNDVNIVNRCNW